jgi:hypothetical protein
MQKYRRKEVKKKKKTMSMLSGLLLSSAIFAGVPAAGAEELVIKSPLDLSGYCHMKFPPIREDTLSWAQPVLDESAGSIIDFYGPCDYDPTGASERTRQRRSSVYHDSE